MNGPSRKRQRENDQDQPSPIQQQMYGWNWNGQNQTYPVGVTPWPSSSNYYGGQQWQYAPNYLYYNNYYSQQYPQINTGHGMEGYYNNQVSGQAPSASTGVALSVTAALLGKRNAIYSGNEISHGAPAYTSDGYAISSTATPEDLEQYAEEERQALAVLQNQWNANNQPRKKTSSGSRMGVDRYFNGMKIPGTSIVLDTPEDVSKWIEERRKRYPTKVNIAKKEQEMQERVSRGEMIPGESRRGPRGKLKYNAHTIKKPQKDKSEQDEKEKDNNDDNEHNDDDEPPEIANSRKKRPKVHPAPNLALSDSPLCKYFIKGACHRGNACHFRHERSKALEKTQNDMDVFKKRPNLLRSLLNKEILSEQSILLQALRFIVMNAFFDCYKLPTEAEPLIEELDQT